MLSKAGLGSRTEARRWIHQGRVELNGRVVEHPDAWVDMERDRVTFDGRPLAFAERVYVLLYKPTGYITTYKDPEGRPTVYDLLTAERLSPDEAPPTASSSSSSSTTSTKGRGSRKSPKAGITTFVSPVGRLDLDTSGLLIMTNDTQFAERITNPESHVPKTYLVKASKILTDDQLEQLRTGIMLSDGMTRPARVTRVRDSGKYTHLEITLTEGRNRQVRRMIEALDAVVLKLVRVAIGSLRIGSLQIGSWRHLSPEELARL